MLPLLLTLNKVWSLGREVGESTTEHAILTEQGFCAAYSRKCGWGLVALLAMYRDLPREGICS